MKLNHNVTRCIRRLSSTSSTCTSAIKQWQWYTRNNHYIPEIYTHRLYCCITSFRCNLKMHHNEKSNSKRLQLGVRFYNDRRKSQSMGQYKRVHTKFGVQGWVYCSPQIFNTPIAFRRENWMHLISSYTASVFGWSSAPDRMERSQPRPRKAGVLVLGSCFVAEKVFRKWREESGGGKVPPQTFDLIYARAWIDDRLESSTTN